MKLTRGILSLLLLSLALSASAADKSLLIDDFEHGLSREWQVEKFKGETDYRVVTEGATKVLQAQSNGTASALIYQQEFSLADYQVLSWRWKIASIVEHGDAARQQSDDYAARVYVIFPNWFKPLTKSLNYVWANRLETGRMQPNAFTGSSMMFAVASGLENSGSWQTVRRNIAEDFRRAFGTTPPDRFRIAIMTDTDNTGGKARAWFDDLRLEKE